MQATHLTQGIIGLFTILAFFSFVFDDASLFIGSSALAAFCICRLVWFLREFNSLADSINVMRITPNLFVRQGSEIGVDTEIVVKKESSLILSVQDVIPAATVLVSGSPIVSVDAAKLGSYRTSYRVKTLASGEHPFGGIRISAADRFFSADVLLKIAPAQDPILHVYPIRRFEHEGDDAFGEEEIDRLAPLTSSGIRSFREYMHGDSLKQIDWKLTAKYGKPYVREYMGRRGESTLIVIDLPDRESNYDTAAFAKMIEAVGGAVSGEAKKGGQSSLMIVSGGNFIRYMPIQRDYSLVLETLKALGPTGRLIHLYRVNTKRDIRAALTRLNDPRAVRYSETLASVWGQFLHKKQRTLFEVQVARVFKTTPNEEMILFSIAGGDDSHLRIIAREAKGLRMKTHLRIPREITPASLAERTRRCGFDSVQVIR